MQDFVTDIETTRRLTGERSEENHRFCNYVKARLDWTDRELDDLVHEVWREVEERIDCTTCANCCKMMALTYQDEDVERLSRRLKMTVLEFEARYVVRDEFGERIGSDIPCPFLDGSRCSVYEDRPADCRGFPHLYKRSFRSRLTNIMEIAAECLIVFNVLEELKNRLHIQRLRQSSIPSQHAGLQSL